MFKREIQFDAENYSVNVLSGNGVSSSISVFDKVSVQIEVEKDPNTQRGKVKMTLVRPVNSANL